MKYLLPLFFFFLSLSLWSQSYNLNNHHFINYGHFLINASNNKIITTLDKNYFSSISYNELLVVSDSQKIYFLDSTNHTQITSYTLINESTDFIKLSYVKNNTDTSIYAIGHRTYDTIKIFQFSPNTNLIDTIIIDSINSPANIVYIDTAHFILILANIRSTSSTNFTFHFLEFSPNGLINTITTTYTDLGEIFSYPVKTLKLSQDLSKLVVVSNAKTYVFTLNQNFNILSQTDFTYTSDKIALLNNKFLFLGQNFDLYRINLITNEVQNLSLPSNIKSLIFSPTAQLLISFYGTSDTSLSLLYNPRTDNLSNAFLDNLPYSFIPQPGSVLYYNYTHPWMDFLWQQESEPGKYTFFLSSDSKFEPDSIAWYIDSHFVTSTNIDNHSFMHVFYTKDTFKITAKAYYFLDNDSVIIEHFLITNEDLLLNLIEQDTLYQCDIPDFYINLSQYSIGNDSIIWYRNREKYSPFTNKSYVHITKPGEYWVYIYLPDTILSDTVHIYYLDKEFNTDEIKLYINNEPYDPNNNTFCTNDGNIYFKFVLPHTPLCNHPFLVYWYFGDGLMERSSELYTDHKYFSPGIYTVLVNIQNTKTGAAYNYIFKINVSINPIKNYPNAINIQQLEPTKLKIGLDYKIEEQKIFQNNIFYTINEQQIFDSSEINIEITDNYYHSQTNLDVKFWALLSTPIAEGTEIRLFNSHNDSITIISNQNSTFSDLSFFYGRPKIAFSNYPHENLSYYPYFWHNDAGLTFVSITNSIPGPSRIFDIFDYLIQEYEIFDWYHYQIYPISLYPHGNILSLTNKPIGQQWKVKFIVHPKDETKNYVSTKAVGINLEKYTINNNYTYSWTANLSCSYQDSVVEILSEYEGRYNLYFKLTDDFGCSYNANTAVYVIDSLAPILPNVFTPNGDGINDRWDLRHAFYKQIYEEHAPVEVKIWNQYGHVVANFLANNVKEWDGTDKNGEKLPPGTYWYLITVANKVHYKGYITILY